MITIKTAHTPGPWRYLQSDNTIDCEGYKSLFFPRSLHVTIAEHLAAAAPDLLAALEGLVRFVEYGLGSKCSIEVAKEAIAKAKGQVIDNSGCGIDPFEGASR